MSYQDFIKSPEWRMQRQRIIERDEVCQNCNNKNNLQVHHLIYTKDLSKVPDEKLITLCKDCHSKLENSKKEALTFFNNIYEYEFFDALNNFIKEVSPLTLFYLYYTGDVQKSFINQKKINHDCNKKRLDNILS